MEDKLHDALEYVNDVAEKNQAIVHWSIPDCDDQGHSVLVENASGKFGMMYHNSDEPDTPVHYYILEVNLYTWLTLEGFTDADIFESGDFHVLEKVDLQGFCTEICNIKKDTGKSAA